VQVWHGASAVRALLQQHRHADDPLPEAADAG
jgi:hypothetical protein